MNSQRRAALPVLQSTRVPVVQIPPAGEPFALAVDREWYGHELERHARRAVNALHARDSAIDARDALLEQLGALAKLLELLELLNAPRRALTRDDCRCVDHDHTGKVPPADGCPVHSSFPLLSQMAARYR